MSVPSRFVGQAAHWVETGDLGEWVQAGATAVLHRVADYRRPGQPSLYSSTGHTAFDSYHHMHIDQLVALSKITGVAYFADMAQSMWNDHPVAP